MELLGFYFALNLLDALRPLPLDFRLDPDMTELFLFSNWPGLMLDLRDLSRDEPPSLLLPLSGCVLTAASMEFFMAASKALLSAYS